MTNNVDGKGVTNSVKIYECLLSAYPAKFRREYGPAMKQLFRDQCRDAWSESRGWGLAGLWLRVLPDFAKTLFVEHLANLNQKESMIKKVISAFRADPRLRTTFIRVFKIVFICAICMGAFMAYWTPHRYFSTVRFEVRKDAQDMPGNGPSSQFWDPYFLATQFRIITSWGILCPVITNMNLQHDLPHQRQGADWSLRQTFEQLSKNVRVSQVRGTSLVEITVKDADPDLAANIANAIAGTYREYRLQPHHQDMLIKGRLPRETQDSVPPSVVIHDSARPDFRNLVQTNLEVFSIWLLRGTLLALVAGGGGAWLVFLIQRKHNRINP